MAVRLKKFSEKEFQDQVIQLARLKRWRVAHFRPAKVQRADGTTYYETPVQADGAGFPDLILVRDRLIAMELKVGSNEPSEAQMQWIEAMVEAGVPAFVLYPKDWRLIEEILA